MPRSRELVVAHYREDLSWVKNVSDAWTPVVYSKGEPADGATVLENIGREAHTYLHHILENYGEFAEWTLFVQGHPFDHVPEFHRFLRELAKDRDPNPGFIWFGLFVDYDTGDGSRLFSPWSKNEDGRGLDVDGFWRKLIDSSPPERFPFFPGGCFAVHAETLLSRPREFYQHAFELSKNFPDAAHCFERCWDAVFGVQGIPDEIAQGELPIYLRPNKSLGITWETRGVIPGHPFYDLS